MSKGGKGVAPDDTPYNPNLRDNFGIACKALGVAPPASVVASLSPEADPDGPIALLAVNEPVGDAAVVALCGALLGRGGKMSKSAYKHLRQLTLWNAAAGDAGAAAVAEVLMHGKLALPLEVLSMSDCGIGRAGAAALGESLMMGANVSLTSLTLDLNGIGDEGVAALALGLRTNRALKRLSLAYCGLTPASASSLSSVLAEQLPVLEELELAGNTRMGAEGLAILALAATGSKSLQELGMRDCGIGSAAVAGNGMEDAVSDLDTGMSLTPRGQTQAALRSLGAALSSPSCGLCRANLDMNPLQAVEVEVLLPFLGPEAGNVKCTAFRLSVSLRPPALFAALFRQPAPVKAKKKK
jgi:hypothetical protein